MSPRWIVSIVLAATTVVSAQYRTLDDRFSPPSFASLEQWKPRAAYIREHVLASAGLLPMPEKTAINAVVTDAVTHTDYILSKVYFESLPGFFVTGDLYRPIGDGPFPAILSPHGHWTYGRFENSDLVSAPGRAINLARQGFVVFTYDMIGYGDSRQLTHTFGGRRENLWGLSLSGLQLWDSIRSLDFLDSLPFVRHDGYGVTGESGGGTQTFLLAAVDDRVAVAAPVNMISLHMQGGCLCENPPGLRLDTNNVEIAATIAPRPLLMVSATGDWTNETLELEYPAMRRMYDLFGASSHVKAVRFNAPHNYNKDSREAVYAWMAQWLEHAPAEAVVKEKSFKPDPLPDLFVFYGRALPPNAITAQQLTDRWISSARSQLASTPPDLLARALRHALGFEWEHISGVAQTSGSADAAQSRPAKDVLLASDEDGVRQALKRGGFTVHEIAFTPFDAAAAAKINHFETYNRSVASQRVADIVAAVRQFPSAAVVADGDAALATILAGAVVPIRRAVLDVDRFDVTSDEAFLDHLYIPGLRRAGDLETAASLSHGSLVVHNAGERFTLKGVSADQRRLTPAEIVGAVKGIARSGGARSATPATRLDAVRVASGRLTGTISEDGSISIFKGIPFAAAPLGNLRWRAPQPVTAWQGVRKADTFGANCIQNIVDVRKPWTYEFMAHGDVSEDCLFLNVWTPATSASERHPVLVYIHGGANTEGSGSVPVYDGEGLASKGLVVVTINYRLGVLGFLAHPDLTTEAPYHASGNYGLLDQIAAVRWVHDNIAAFGGDPARISVAGQSAGAQAVRNLLISPLAAGQFSRAIAESGASVGGLGTTKHLADAEKDGLSYAEQKGAHSIAELRSLPWRELAAPNVRFGPNIDGYTLPLAEAAAFAAGKQNDVPVLTGSNRDEGGASPQPAITLDAFRKQAVQRYGDRAQDFLALYPATTDDEARAAQNESSRDSSRVSTYLWALQRAQTAKSDTFTYFWQHTLPGPDAAQYGAFHTSEVPYVMNTLNRSDRPFTADDRRIAAMMSSYWANFAATGDPSGEGLPQWASVREGPRKTMSVGDIFGAIPIGGSDAKIRFFTDALARPRPTTTQPGRER